MCLIALYDSVHQEGRRKSLSAREEGWRENGGGFPMVLHKPTDSSCPLVLRLLSLPNTTTALSLSLSVSVSLSVFVCVCSSLLIAQSCHCRLNGKERTNEGRGGGAFAFRRNEGQLSGWVFC